MFFNKNIIIKLLFIIIINFNYNKNYIQALQHTINKFYFANNTIKFISHIYNNYNAINNNINGVNLINKYENEVLTNFKELSQKLQAMEDETTKIIEITIDGIYETLNNHELKKNFEDIIDLRHQYIAQESTSKLLLNNLNKLNNKTIINFAEWNTSPNSYGIQSLVNIIHMKLFGVKPHKSEWNKGFLNKFADYLMMNTSVHHCYTKQSSQQIIYLLYDIFSFIEIKSYLITQYSWMILKVFNNGDYLQEFNIIRDTFNKRIMENQEYLQNIYYKSDRTIYRCDPDVSHTEGETYVQLTKLLQGYIENEADLNNDGTCKEDCNYYQFTENYGCFDNLFCSKQPRCNGKILNCRFVESNMDICQAKSNSIRRYEYIRYSTGKVLGNIAKTCERPLDSIESWHRYLIHHCSYCLCICDDSSKSDRYINLRETLSDIKNNMIITGLRFRKINRIIHLQIQEGKLENRGFINETSLNWQALDDYRIINKGIKNGIDYHTLSWNNRRIDLHNLNAKPKHVVTGVRFRVLGIRLNFEIRITEVNFMTGELIEPGEWIFNYEQKEPIKLQNPDIPIRSKNSYMLSNDNQYVEFTHSDFNDDAAQTTVPFFDAQDVISIPPVPLAGIGLYHKMEPRYGGFIAPKIITYDYTNTYA